MIEGGIAAQIVGLAAVYVVLTASLASGWLLVHRLQEPAEGPETSSEWSSPSGRLHQTTDLWDIDAIRNRLTKTLGQDMAEDCMINAVDNSEVKISFPMECDQEDVIKSVVQLAQDDYRVAEAGDRIVHLTV